MMRCPLCNVETVVTESRYVEGDNSVRRRRKCSACNHRFTTYEWVITRRDKNAARKRIGARAAWEMCATGPVKTSK